MEGNFLQLVCYEKTINCLKIQLDMFFDKLSKEYTTAITRISVTEILSWKTFWLIKIMMLKSQILDLAQNVDRNCKIFVARLPIWLPKLQPKYPIMDSLLICGQWVLCFIFYYLANFLSELQLKHNCTALFSRANSNYLKEYRRERRKQSVSF